MWARIGRPVAGLLFLYFLAHTYAAQIDVPTTQVDLGVQDMLPLTSWLVVQNPDQANSPAVAQTLPGMGQRSLQQIVQSGASDPVIRMEKILASSPGTAVRASCELAVHDRTDAILMYGISGEATLHLNGKLVLTHTPQPPSVAVPFSRDTDNLEVVPITLPAGKSILSVDFPPGTDARGFSLRLATLNSARQYFLKTEPYTSKEIFLSFRIYKENSPLTLSPELQAALTDLRIPYSVRIIDLGGNVRYRGVLSSSGTLSSANHLPAGLYNTTLESSGLTLHQTLFIGDPTAYFQTVDSRARALSSTLRDERLRFDLEALAFRFRHLYEPVHYLPNDNDWQRKIVFTLDEYQQMVITCTRNPTDEWKRPGLHYRGFRSSIDGQVQYYMLYHPVTSDKVQRLPLVIIVPYETSPLRPFLESIHVAKFGYLRTIARFANQYGYAVLMPDMRGNIGISPIGEADLFECLHDVERDVPVNTNSIYLLGFSFGATRALMLGIHHPDMFAAIASVGSTLSTVHRLVLMPDQAQMYASRSWLAINGLRDIGSLTNTPLYFMHGDRDAELPIAVFQNFVAYCRNAGVETALDVIPGMDHVNYPVSPFPRVFEFFKGKTLPASPRKVVIETGDLNYSTAYWVRISRSTAPLSPTSVTATYDDECHVRVQEANVAEFSLQLGQLKCTSGSASVAIDNQQPISVSRGQGMPVSFDVNPARSHWQVTSNPQSVPTGPLFHLFERSFKVVVPEPTAGPSGDAAVRSAAMFCQGWMSLFFVPCPAEVQFTTSSLSDSSNLVVIGPSSHVPYIKGLLKQAGVVTTNTSIEIEGKRFEGPNLSYLLLTHGGPGELRQILIAGGTDSTSCYFAPATLVLTGWYDVAVWNCSNTQTPLLLDTGYFEKGAIMWTSDLR